MPVQLKNQKDVIKALNEALAWELRASALYAHYAAYVKGLESLTLADHFKAEATESFGHADAVRGIIADLGGEATTTRASDEIVHTEDTTRMLEEGLKTEQVAAETYERILPMVKDHLPFWHTLAHILQDEQNAVVEMENLLGR